MGVKQNTVFCFFLPLLSFENLTSPIIFLKKKKATKKKKKVPKSEECLQLAPGQDYRRNRTGDCKAGIPLLLNHHL